MAKKLDPKIIEAARNRGSRERSETQKITIQEALEDSKRGKGVVVIHPPVKQYANEAERPKLRVGAYCRVSTQEEEQQGSFDMQVHHFEQRIMQNAAWVLVEINKARNAGSIVLTGLLDLCSLQ